LKIKLIEWRNIGPFGNKLQSIEFPEGGGLWMVLGKNGNGKCLSRKTKLNVYIENEYIEKQFLNYLKK